MNDSIILVDENDDVIGYTEKMDAHIRKLQHRAFSIFIFDWKTGKMLLQKRARGKYHSGGLWTNACCSHPRRGEKMETCLSERLREELGMEVHLRIKSADASEPLLNGTDVIYSCGKFSYLASFDGLYENEIDYVFLYSPIPEGIAPDSVSINMQEVEDIKWISIPELELWMEREPQAFTAWFKPAFELVCEVLGRQAGHMEVLSHAE